ncbi:MAG: hypothetical protein LBL75_02625 [Rickettsiales bacterium]|jgi:hypothetical protein|nr:hypothetical protein [Rickettsiales bacterium]
MKKLFRFLILMIFVMPAFAASAPNSRGASSYSRAMSMPSMGGVIGANVGANMSTNVPTGNEVGACPPGGCNPIGMNDCGCATCPCPGDNNNNGGGNSGATPPVETYSVNKCMTDVLACVNSGGLSGGFVSLYDPVVRNSVAGGGICLSQTEKCVAQLPDVYADGADVWADFYSRVVSPEYFNLVLRNTGLTPNQAEKTCAMLNGGSDFKTQNAKWDAINARCQVRVAAYKEGELITNDWLYGLAGDDRPAQVYLDTGTDFKCGKDLFEFSLLNDTHTVATTIGTLSAATTAGVAIGSATNNTTTKIEIAGDGSAIETEVPKETHVLRNTAITAGIGAGATGLASAITYFVEKNQIKCRIGNNLGSVELSKSGSVDSLKNYYTRFGLSVPETPGVPSDALVTSRETWALECNKIINSDDCSGSVINYRGGENGLKSRRVYNACIMSDGICRENMPIMKSNF